jgi:hypothetical protein
MIYKQESWWVEYEYSNYTEEQIDNILDNADNYLDGHVKRARFEKIKRQAK